MVLLWYKPSLRRLTRGDTPERICWCRFDMYYHDGDTSAVDEPK